MMSNPLTEERLNQLKDDAQELLKNFSILYMKNYGVALFEKIRSEVQPNEEGTKFKLSHRPWDAVECKTAFTGECFVQSGEGPGSFGSWKKQFLVERHDHNIDIYPDEKAYLAKKKPSGTIFVAGYNVVTDVSSHYRAELQKMAEPLGMSDSELDELTIFSQYSWALAHPQRTNYVFQLHKAKQSGCCFGGGNAVEPEDAGAEKRDEVVLFVKAMQKLKTKVSPRGSGVANVAFDMACQQIGRKVDRLEDWTDDGKEAEMLVSMLMEGLLPGLRDDILRDLKGPTNMKLKLWYKTRAVIYATLLKISEPSWAKIQEGAGQLGAKIEPTIRPAVVKIVAVKGKVEEKIRANIANKLGEFLAKYVTPFVKPIIDAFEKPLKEGFEKGLNVFESKLNLQELPDDQTKRNELLDSIAREDANVTDLQLAADQLVKPLNELKSLKEDVFEAIDPDALSTQAQDLLLRALDAASFTVRVRLEAGQAKDEQLKQQILKDYAHDTLLMRCEFVKTVSREILIGVFKKLTAPITDPIIETVNSEIPEEMQEFLDIEALLDRFIDTFVGSAIDKIVEPAFQKP